MENLKNIHGKFLVKFPFGVREADHIQKVDKYDLWLVRVRGMIIGFCGIFDVEGVG